MVDWKHACFDRDGDGNRARAEARNVSGKLFDRRDFLTVTGGMLATLGPGIELSMPSRNPGPASDALMNLEGMNAFLK